MAKHHAHSQRARRRGPRIRTDRELADQQRRIELRRARLAAGPVKVVVRLPGPAMPRQSGTPQPPGPWTPPAAVREGE